jgi:ATP-dependent DNA ligase
MKFDTFTYFYPEKPVLIDKNQSLFQMFSKSPDWVAERKYNGNRLELHYFEGKFQFWNRYGGAFKRFEAGKELLDILNKLPLKGYCIFDGELRNNKVIGIKQKIMLFDVFMWDGELVTAPFKNRRQMLADMIPVDGDPVGIPYQFATDFPKVFEEVIKDAEIEGLVMKKLSGTLGISRKANNDSRWMYKVRRPGSTYQF